MHKPQPGWPMSSYLSAWRTFRALSDEPQRTAEHVVAQPAWPTRSSLRILDLGCGDGLMVQAFLLSLGQTVARALLLDPDNELLGEAAARLGELALKAVIEPRLGGLEDQAAVLARQVDVGLAIHVVYLVEPEQFQQVVKRWPAGVPLYVVIDAPDSVFSKVWRYTAPEFAARTQAAHRYLSSGSDGQSVSVRQTRFSTRVANPFSLSEEVAEHVFSLISYAEFSKLSAENRERTQQIIREHADGKQLVCTCSCYEIVR